MTIYRLINDIYQCHEAFVDFKAMRRQFNEVKVWFPQENISLISRLKNEWTPVDIKFDSDSKKNLIPDISVWNLSCLTLSSKAYEILKELLNPAGEFLALKNGFYLYNCLESITADAVDAEKTKLKIEEVDSNHIPASLGLRVDKIKGKVIFKPGFLENSFLICQESFKQIAEKNQLKGVIFEENLSQMFPVKK